MWKVLLFLAGAAGASAFFLPLVEYRDQDGALVSRTSAYEIVTTETDTTDYADIAMSFGMSPEDAELLAERMDQGIVAYRGTLAAYYAPAALLALLGLINLARWKMGRVTGLFAMLFGAGCAAVFMIFYLANKKQADPNVALGYGIWLLAGAAAAGVFAGIGALIAPDRGGYVELTQRVRVRSWDDP